MREDLAHLTLTYLTTYIVYVFVSCRYHIMRELINEQGCLRMYRAFPVICCCAEDTNLQAVPDEDTMREFLKEPDFRNVSCSSTETDHCHHHRPETVDMMTQTSLEEDPAARKKRDEDEYKEKEDQNNGDLVNPPPSAPPVEKSEEEPVTAKPKKSASTLSAADPDFKPIRIKTPPSTMSWRFSDKKK